MRKNDDLISRQEVIRIIDRNGILGQGLLNDTLDHIAERIMQFPSAQPEEIDSESEKACNELRKMCEELKAHIEYLRRQNDSMKGEIKALIFAVRCCGVSGNEVQYESD